MSARPALRWNVFAVASLAVASAAYLVVASSQAPEAPQLLAFLLVLA